MAPLRSATKRFALAAQHVELPSDAAVGALPPDLASALDTVRQFVNANLPLLETAASELWQYLATGDEQAIDDFVDSALAELLA